MTEYILNRTGKFLFPNLPRDQRKQRLSIIMLILLTSVFGNGTLVFCIMHGWH